MDICGSDGFANVYVHLPSNSMGCIQYVQLFTCNHTSVKFKKKREKENLTCDSASLGVREHRGGWYLVHV